MQQDLFIGGRWVPGPKTTPVRNKYNGEVVGSVVEATREDVQASVAAAVEAAPGMADMPAHKRAEFLRKTSEAIAARKDEFARTIAAEAGKAMKYARAEVDRAVATFAIAAEEAKRIHGETVPMDALPAGEGYLGFWVRRPVGVVAAITPFNFPLNLAAHKIAPALAAGNALILKPASATPLTAGLLCRALEGAGVPAGAINLIHGPGGAAGEWLVTDDRVAKVTFTGSRAVGRQILAAAGVKKITLELGNASPVVIAADAEIDLAARKCAVGAFYNSGQVCISVQRIYVDGAVYDAFLRKFVAATEAMVVGDPLDEKVDVGPMIDLGEAQRIEAWVKEAVASGARVETGGRREGPVYWPTVLTGVAPDMKVVCQEAFGPIASVMRYDDFEAALAAADATEYGLQASVFTRDIGRIFLAMKRLNFGGLIINDGPNYRLDHMPYGGMRQSGLGREGVRFAIEEMTNIQMVAIRKPA